MHRETITSTIITLIQLLAPAQSHVLSPSSSSSPSPSPSPSPQTCPTNSTPLTFTLTSITYQHLETSPNTPTAAPNTTQLVFELSNPTTGISTGCALQSVPRSDGAWPSGETTTCLERSITVDGKSYPVATTARVDWDAWWLAVNQTWVCEESVTISQFSALTLVPNCTEYNTGTQYIKECTAPDTIVAATSDSLVR
ncbi:hypothetical protein F4859DRAFT_518969 [Xylaria cf. heliscus]|nr:hypothetical protein F4859DRAFT_518969 [Xylaria cf. heliscus]